MSRSANLYKRDRGRGLKRALIVVLSVAVLAIAVGGLQLLRTPPRPTIVTSLARSSFLPGSKPSLPWASQGASDIGLLGVGSTGNHGQRSPIGLASVAKIITALVLLHDHPLAIGQNGPTLTVSSSDVATYQSMLAAQDSVMVVTTGETLSELQALEALLIPSADNVAIMLADWDAGSTSAFVAKMNAMAQQLGMHSSHYADPSGLISSTSGTASDQLIAAEALLANPTLAQIVSMPQATLPVAGVVYNVNSLVGHDGITGVKTGSTPAGGNYAFSGTATLPSNAALPGSVSANPTIVGVVLGQQGYAPLPNALSAGQALLDAFRKVPQNMQVLSAGQIVGVIHAPGQADVNIVTKTGLTLIGWPTLLVHYSFVPSTRLAKSFSDGYRVGMLTVSIGSEHASVPVVSTGRVIAPGLGWKLRRL